MTAPFDEIRERIAAAPDSETGLSTLIEALAQRIKATSNDQNVQKLARELRAAAPSLTKAITKKPTLAGAD